MSQATFMGSAINGGKLRKTGNLMNLANPRMRTKIMRQKKVKYI